jgi:hypothetical protein
MAEESLFKLYSKGGEGIIDSGFYSDSSCFLQITGGSVVVSIGTETAEAQSGDFLFVPSSRLFCFDQGQFFERFFPQMDGGDFSEIWLDDGNGDLPSFRARIWLGR